MIDRLLGIVAPHSCCGCGNLGSLLCNQCNYDIVSEPFSQCLGCLSPTPDGSMCRSCRSKMNCIDGWAVGAREGALKLLLDRYKFHSARAASSVVAELLDKRLPLLPQSTVVVPVPTSPARRRARGFDHTKLIACDFARRRRMRSATPLVRDTYEVQHFKSRRERYASAANGLRIKTPISRSVLLIDDIYTTGATMQACINMLHQNGAEAVFVVVIARQVLDEPADL